MQPGDYGNWYTKHVAKNLDKMLQTATLTTHRISSIQTTES